MPTNLGPCSTGWCNNDAVLYVSGPTLGHSPRLLIIAGARADFLVDHGDALNAMCGECAVQVLDQMVIAATSRQLVEEPA